MSRICVRKAEPADVCEEEAGGDRGDTSMCTGGSAPSVVSRSAASASRLRSLISRATSCRMLNTASRACRQPSKAKQSSRCACNGRRAGQAQQTAAVHQHGFGARACHTSFSSLAFCRASRPLSDARERHCRSSESASSACARASASRCAASRCAAASLVRSAASSQLSRAIVASCSSP